MNADYASTRRQAMMQKYDIDRRLKPLRRAYYHALDYAGTFFWSVGIVTVIVGIVWMWIIERTK